MNSLVRLILSTVFLCLLASPSWAIQNSVKVTAAEPVLTEGDTAPLSADKGGVLRSDPRAATAAGHSHTTAATITLTPTSGMYVYITGIDIQNCATGTAVTAAAPTYITTTNLTGSPQFQLGSGVTAGQCQATPVGGFSSPLRATAVTTAVTFVLPTFATNQVASVNVYWYSAP